MRIVVSDKDTENLPADAILISTNDGDFCSAHEVDSINPLFQYEIHVKFPPWKNGKSNERSNVVFAYKNVLRLVKKLDLISITIPGNILTGYPPENSADFISNAILESICGYPELDTVFISCVHR